MINKITKEFVKISFGNILEWYDFTLYGLFAVQLAKAFFPENNQHTGILLVFATFGVGFLGRPIGSIIFGYIGDKRDKTFSVNIAIYVMAIATILIGILPTYNSLGIFAPICLVIIRLIQGISAGGQFAGLITIAVDSSKSSRSLLGSLVQSISILGSLLASLVGLIIIKLTFAIEIWRIPFILSGMLFVIYLIFKPKAVTIGHEGHHFNFFEIFRLQKKELSYLTLLSICTGALYYFIYTYSISFFQVHLNLTSDVSYVFINIMLALSILLYPIIGYLADIMNNRVLLAKIFTISFILPIILLIILPTKEWAIFSQFIFLAICFCGLSATVTSIFAECFYIQHRMTACSLAFNIGTAIAGFIPFLAELIIRINPYAIIIMLCFVTISTFILLNLIGRSDGYTSYNAK